MKIKLFLILLLLSGASANAQRLLKISVSVNGKEEEISSLVRRGNIYASAKDIARVLTGNYYYNEEASKVEIKFRDYNLKFTGRNQFVILSSRKDGSKRVLQLPVSTMLIKGDVFVPLVYCVDYLSYAYGGIINFDPKEKNMTVIGSIPQHPEIAGKIKLPPKTTDAPSTPKPKPRKHVKINSRYDIYGIDIEEKANGTMIRILSQKKIVKQPRSSIKNGVLYLYLAGVNVDPDSIRKVKPNGFVKKIKYKSVNGNPQFEFFLKEGYSSHETFYDIGTNDVIVAIHNDKFNLPSEDFTKTDKEHWNFDVIVIDAGHGGKDPGAIGITGVKEKDVNLGIALKLGKLIEKNLPSVKVVYTRKTDAFVELYKRGKIANENNGKLFISLHANSLGRNHSNVRGADVYLLRPGKTKAAIEIAEIENSVINYEADPAKYQRLTDENFILVTMAHSAYMRYSEKFSEILSNEWSKKVGIPARGVKQAGFFVLVGASMPSVLVETGFITNRADEKYLSSAKGQQIIAETIFNAIKKYRDYYNESNNEGI
ncbi:MAG: hypothetical protein GXO87_09535 [Chlorobi bacterium]|nr:hypothetical protein [Chlorobiota bacterium]